MSIRLKPPAYLNPPPYTPKPKPTLKNRLTWQYNKFKAKVTNLSLVQSVRKTLYPYLHGKKIRRQSRNNAIASEARALKQAIAAAEASKLASLKQAIAAAEANQARALASADEKEAKKLASLIETNQQEYERIMNEKKKYEAQEEIYKLESKIGNRESLMEKHIKEAMKRSKTQKNTGSMQYYNNHLRGLLEELRMKKAKFNATYPKATDY